MIPSSFLLNTLVWDFELKNKKNAAAIKVKPLTDSN